MAAGGGEYCFGEISLSSSETGIALIQFPVNILAIVVTTKVNIFYFKCWENSTQSPLKLQGHELRNHTKS